MLGSGEGDRLLASNATGHSPILLGRRGKQHRANSTEGAGQDWSGDCSIPTGDGSIPTGDGDAGLGGVGEA